MKEKNENCKNLQVSENENATHYKAIDCNGCPNNRV